MRRTLMTILTIMVATMMGFAKNPWDFRGVVYDVGLRFTPESCSVDSLDTALVAYDMGVIANILRANAVRQEGVDLVFVAGCEYSLFNEGVFAGKDINGRLASLMSLGEGKDMAAFQRSLQEKYQDLNRILARVSQAVRQNYKGLVTYASGTWEDVDWSLLDIVGVDYYRDRQTAEAYVNGIQRPLRLRVLLPHYALSPGRTRPGHDLVCHREDLSGG